MSGMSSIIFNRLKEEIWMIRFSSCIWSPFLPLHSTSFSILLWLASKWKTMWRGHSSAKSLLYSQLTICSTFTIILLISIGVRGKHPLWIWQSWPQEIFHHQFWTATTCTSFLINSWKSVGLSSGRISQTISSVTFSTSWGAPSDSKIFSKKSN